MFPHKDQFKVASPKFRHHSQELEKILEITPIGMEDPTENSQESFEIKAKQVVKVSQF